MTLICGIDESGSEFQKNLYSPKGPVIGPLVMVGIVIKEKNLSKLKKLGVKDSKLLTKEKREELFDKILEITESYKIISVAPDVIDEPKLPSDATEMASIG